MKAEIGFAWSVWDDGPKDERLRLTLTPNSSTEATMLQEYARRLGWPFDISSGHVTVDEPKKETP